jgi:ribosomal protein L28
VAGGRWKKRAQKTPKLFRPNLQPVMIIDDSKEIRVKMCTKCLKRVKKDLAEGVRPFVILKNMPNLQSVNTKSPSALTA